ncbi:Zn-ribbon domain-containing OB-fold protein [Humitalea sp. 24SJ18S-53]|uniref:Zn-ribbon domain-containing OB-fold protein n=1 Tax=Humitalea sp. 24SJ18S-53 TaxID=3422307 RepID=UPI003D666395
MTPASNRAIPAPVIDPTNKPFWDSAREGRLLIGLCGDTGKHFFYPRGSSPFTLSPNVTLVESKGTGVIYSYSVMRVAEPYAIAYVELDEGPRILTNIVDCDMDALKIGQRVSLVWKPTVDNGAPVPMFAPV